MGTSNRDYSCREQNLAVPCRAVPARDSCPSEYRTKRAARDFPLGEQSFPRRRTQAESRTEENRIAREIRHRGKQRGREKRGQKDVGQRRGRETFNEEGNARARARTERLCRRRAILGASLSPHGNTNFDCQSFLTAARQDYYPSTLVPARPPPRFLPLTLPPSLVRFCRDGDARFSFVHELRGWSVWENTEAARPRQVGENISLPHTYLSLSLSPYIPPPPCQQGYSLSWLSWRSGTATYEATSNLRSPPPTYTSIVDPFSRN